MTIKEICFATQNQGKCIEACQVGKGFGLNVMTPDDFRREGAQCMACAIPVEAFPDVDETEDNYLGNARLKALECFRWAGIPAFADDAGLEVEALQGGPGVWSARYAGPEADAEANIDKLLAALAGVADRWACFRSVVCLVINEDSILNAEATLTGKIALERRGRAGFGYDSIFLVDGYDRTLAELKGDGVPVKTHRIQALEKLFGMINS